MMGLLCGARIGMDPNALYRCANGMTDAGITLSVAQMCGSACVQHADNMGDACPCPAGDGTYCGARVGGDPHVVYQCTGGRTTAMQRCDVCGAGTGNSDTCAPCQYGNGLYCGQTVGAESNRVYNCMNGVVTVAQECAAMCMVNPPGVNDACQPCPFGNGLYCGGPIGYNANVLYQCTNGVLSVAQMCPTMCHSAPAGMNDYCESTCGGGVSCAARQWWNAPLTYGPYRITVFGTLWWDTDLAVSSGTPVQLRHDSRLEHEGTYAWGWMPTFTDMVTGQRFQFLHLRPTNRYTTNVGQVYCAGTVVGLSGGDTGATGYPTYSTGAHLCVETINAYRTAFPAGTDACR
jgi:hypothetical protein